MFKSILNVTVNNKVEWNEVKETKKGQSFEAVSPRRRLNKSVKGAHCTVHTAHAAAEAKAGSAARAVAC